jgi:hypothetical protein
MTVERALVAVAWLPVRQRVGKNEIPEDRGVKHRETDSPG